MSEASFAGSFSPISGAHRLFPFALLLGADMSIFEEGRPFEAMIAVSGYIGKDDVRKNFSVLNETQPTLPR